MKKITVSSPLLPPLAEFLPYLEKIWDRKWLTNNGLYHQELEAALCRFLGVPYVSIYSNGTLALIAAFQALKLTGEVITTPYSFVATAHSLVWNNLVPVFSDIDPVTFNLDPSKIEEKITSRTTAILPVHVYGNPCSVEQIQKIADKHGLKVIYDAAHAFGVRQNGCSIVEHGDLSVLSFHATKTYSTIEGGAIICHSPQMKQHLDDLKNFGFRGELEVAEFGINAKMNELQAAFGLLSLNHLAGAIEKRKLMTEHYRSLLKDIPGIELPPELEGVESNCSYFPVLIKRSVFPRSRDAVYETLKNNDILARRYFYPLISDFEPYKRRFTVADDQVSVAKRVASEIICLPMHADLEFEDVDRVVAVLKACSLAP